MKHSFRTMVDSKLRAQKLTELFARIPIDKSLFADVSSLKREQLRRWLDEESKWQSLPALKKLAAALGTDHVELERVLDGEGSMDDAVKKARSAVKRNREALEQRKAVTKRVRKAAIKFEEATGESPMDGLEPFAGALVWKMVGPNPSDDLLGRTVAFVQEAMTEILRKAELELKPASDPPPHQRSGGTDRKLKRH